MKALLCIYHFEERYSLLAFFYSTVDDTDVVDNWDWKSYDINLIYNGKEFYLCKIHSSVTACSLVSYFARIFYFFHLKVRTNIILSLCWIPIWLVHVHVIFKQGNL